MPSITPSSATLQRVEPTANKSSSALPSIIDIRGEHVEINLKEQIASMFNPEDGPRKLPTLLLYNERGLQIFEDVCWIYQSYPPSLLLILLQITYLDEYYLTNYEIELLRKSSAEIASQIPEDSMVIELGSGLVKFPMIQDTCH